MRTAKSDLSQIGLRSGMKIMFTVFVGLLCGMIALQVASAQSYPDRPIHVIIPVEPGLSTTDSITRMLGRHLSAALGKPVVMDNRPGANGQIGTEIVARSAPDGYTLLVGYTTTLSLGPYLYTKLSYDPVKDFAPVARISVAPFVVAVNSAVPATNIKELITLAKTRPGQLNFGSAGSGSTPHLCGELLKTVANIDITNVPFKAAGSAMTALFGGEVQVCCQAAGGLMPGIKAGKIRALAVAATDRLSMLPDLPTAQESGLAGFEVEVFLGLMAPAKTPDPIIRRLFDEIARIVNTPDMKNFILSQGAVPALMDPTKFGAYLNAERNKWAKVIKTAGLKLD